MRGQYFSFDAIVASIVFVLALMALLGYWHSVRSYLDFQDSDIGKETIRVSDMIFASPHYSGSSEDCDSIDRLGLSKSGYGSSIDPRLIDCAEDMSSQELKESLSTPYDAYFEITYIPSGKSVQIGKEPPSDCTEVVQMRRLATVDDGDNTYPATVDIRLYR